MIVRRLFEPALAQASYLVGCAAAGAAMVIDPHRDAEVYLAAAAADGLTITHVTETHIHADFLSGSRELAHRTGAKLLLSDEGDANWKYGFAREAQLIRHGDRITIGKVIVDVIHTPGHTPEHLSFLITDGAVSNAPNAAATGDFIFVGHVGRPDLLEPSTRMKSGCRSGLGTAPDRRAAKASAPYRTARSDTNAASTGRSRPPMKRHLFATCLRASPIRRSTSQR